MKILAIVPAYNEQASICNTVADLQQYAPEVDIVVVNDSSTDRTKEILRERQIPFLDLPVNLGIGGGVQTGYRYALEQNYDIAVQFDGDGQHLATYLQNLIAPIERGEADMTIGSRFLFLTDEGFQSSAIRRLGIGFLSTLINVLCGIRVRDVTSGMRAVNRRVMEAFAQDYVQDYPEPEAILAAGLQGFRVLEIPVQMRERQGGISSISPARSAYYMIKVSLSLLLTRLYT